MGRHPVPSPGHRACSEGAPEPEGGGVRLEGIGRGQLIGDLQTSGLGGPWWEGPWSIFNQGWGCPSRPLTPDVSPSLPRRVL